MDNTMLAAIIGGVFGIISGIISAIITGKYTVRGAKIAVEASRPHTNVDTGDTAHKYQRRQVRLAIAIGIIVFLIISFSVSVLLGQRMEFGIPGYYMEVDGQDYGYEIFNLATLKYQHSLIIFPSEAYTHDKTAQNYSTDGRYEDALDEHTKAIELEPDNAFFSV